jgi:MoaA/NifB/PqqE/SkfB family radical SAM enzyme
MTNAVATREGALILDSHKLSYHMDRVDAWEAGERIAPVSVDMSLTRACGAMCSFCYAMMQESQARSSVKESHALNLLDDFAEIGIRSVSLVSDGESTLARAYVPFIQHAATLGIDVGNATNAWQTHSRTEAFTARIAEDGFQVFPLWWSLTPPVFR